MKPIEYRSKITCQNVYLILGNHDKRNHYKDDLQGFLSVKDVDEIIYCNQRISRIDMTIFWLTVFILSMVPVVIAFQITDPE